MNYRSALDLMGVYMTPQMGVGRRLRISTIDRKLASWPLPPVLDLLSQLAFRVDSAHGPTAQLELVEQVLPPGHAPRARELLRRDERLSVLSSQAVTILALHALLSCTPEGSAPPPDRLGPMLGELALGMAGLLDEELEHEELLLQLVRLELWFRIGPFCTRGLFMTSTGGTRPPTACSSKPWAR